VPGGGAKHEEGGRGEQGGAEGLAPVTVQRLVLDTAVEPADYGRKRRDPEPQQRGLVEVRQGGAQHGGGQRDAPAGRGGRGEGGHDGQPGQPIKHSYLQELVPVAPVAPVRDGVEREMRGDADQEGRHRPPDRPADQCSGQDVVRQQHPRSPFPSSNHGM
jgi:hypothetical protein